MLKAEVPLQFITHVQQLMADITTWCASKSWELKKEQIQIHEGRYEAYTLDKVNIYSDSKKIADIYPVGFLTIGADGRIDIKGALDSISLVYLRKGGPHISFSTNEKTPTSRPIYKGIDCDGWYWIENKISRKGYLLTEDIFFDIIAEVSDYA